MSDDPASFEKTAEQWSAFQKIWADTFTRMIQAGCTFTPDSAPPDVLRQIRSGIFQALSQSWDEFLRSPQFLEGMKQWMGAATTMRKTAADLLTKAQHEMQMPAREDAEDILLSVRQVENRILDRIEDLAKQVAALEGRLGPAPKPASRAPKAARRRAAPKTKSKR